MRTSKTSHALILGSVLAVTIAAIADSRTPASLVGTWRLVSFEGVENGQTIRRFGDHPMGLFVYTADGHVAIQIAPR